MIAAIPTNRPHSLALRARSPAKVNLTLDVLGKRGDGYHEIRSVVIGVGLYDTLDFRSAADGALRLGCDDPELPTDDRNLVIKAARALADASGLSPNAGITLEKRIPLAAGLGGGSGNAAAALAALNRLWNLHLSNDELMKIGAAVGSDVPLFFALPSARISGRGEVVESLEMHWSGWVLLVFAGCAVSTKAVYETWTEGDRAGDACDRTALLAAARTAHELTLLCSNDLEPAVFRVAPRVRELWEAVRSATGRSPRITGAGQTAYLLFDDPREGESVRSLLVSRNIGTGSCLVPVMTGPMMVE